MIIQIDNCFVHKDFAQGEFHKTICTFFFNFHIFYMFLLQTSRFCWDQVEGLLGPSLADLGARIAPHAVG